MRVDADEPADGVPAALRLLENPAGFPTAPTRRCAPHAIAISSSCVLVASVGAVSRAMDSVSGLGGGAHGV